MSNGKMERLVFLYDLAKGMFPIYPKSINKRKSHMKALKITLISLILVVFNMCSVVGANERLKFDTRTVDMTKEESQELELATKQLADLISKIARRSHGVPSYTAIHEMNLKLDQSVGGVHITTTFAGMTYCSEDPPGQSCMGACPCY